MQMARHSARSVPSRELTADLTQTLGIIQLCPHTIGNVDSVQQQCCVVAQSEPLKRGSINVAETGGSNGLACSHGREGR
jgi:hypothetical protein